MLVVASLDDRICRSQKRWLAKVENHDRTYLKGLDGGNHVVLEDVKWGGSDEFGIGRRMENVAAGTGMRLNRIPNPPQIKFEQATEINEMVH